MIMVPININRTNIAMIYLYYHLKWAIGIFHSCCRVKTKLPLWTLTWAPVPGVAGADLGGGEGRSSHGQIFKNLIFLRHPSKISKDICF